MSSTAKGWVKLILIGLVLSVIIGVGCTLVLPFPICLYVSWLLGLAAGGLLMAYALNQGWID
jgi:hypothetical protein